MEFTKSLWKGRRIQHTENTKLKKALTKARLQLIFTAYFGLFILLVFLSSEFTGTL